MIIIAGCSGGGKSTLLEALKLKGEFVVAEPGRRIVAQELARNGLALPWVDPIAFVRRAIDLSLEDLENIPAGLNRVFFDRGLIDAIIALCHLTGDHNEELYNYQSQFFRQVFMAPPWREIFKQDEERRHSFDDAVAEYNRLMTNYPHLGFELILLPKVGVEERVDFVTTQSARHR